MKKAFEKGVKSYEESISGLYSNSELIRLDLRSKFIQSLSTQQLPKELIPIIEYYIPWKTEWTEIYQTGDNKIRLKTITNSEGKLELVGNYKY